MVPGYGFELNDSLNLFNLAPKFDAASGNPGANDAAPDKRPMGSMTPTIVLKDGEPILLTGTYGGPFIPSLVFNVVTNVVDHRMTLQQAVDAPRMWGAVANVNRAFRSRRSPRCARSAIRSRGGRRSDSARRAPPASTRRRSTSSASPT